MAGNNLQGRGAVINGEDGDGGIGFWHIVSLSFCLILARRGSLAGKGDFHARTPARGTLHINDPATSGKSRSLL